MKTLLLIILMSLAMASCKTSFRITVKEPARIQVQESVANVGVVDKVDLTNTTESVVGTILNAEPFNGRKVVAEQVPTGVISGLNNSNTLTGRIFLSDSLHLSSGLVNWAYLDSIGEVENLDAFIEIVEVEANTNSGGIAAAATSGGNSSRITSRATVNIYVVENRQEIENYRVEEILNTSNRSAETVTGIVDEVRRKKEKYRGLGLRLGNQIGRLIYPNWVWVNRTYYSKGNDILKRAKKMIQNGNWDIAEEQLLMGVGSSSTKAEGRIYYNLALVKEGQGDLDKAIEYAKTSALRYGDKMAPDYLSTLQNRKRVIERAAANQP